MKKLNRENIIGIAALLVHAAKIDQHYSDKEKDLLNQVGQKKIEEPSLNLELPAFLRDI